MSCAPVIVFSYKRKEHIKKCLQALNDNPLAEESELYIYSDGPKNSSESKEVKEVRDYIREFSADNNFLRIYVTEAVTNKGLANSIITGVTEVIHKCGKAIIVEDDLITSKDFLQYMNDGLNFYEAFKQIGSVSAYTYPVNALKDYKRDIYVIRKGECWGWATWKDRWENVDWTVANYDSYSCDRKKRKAFNSLEKGLDEMLGMQMQGKLDSWAVRWCYHLFERKLLTVYPSVSRAYNCGFDGSGTHCGIESKYGEALNDRLEKCKFDMLQVNSRLERQVANYNRGSLPKRIIQILRKIIHGGEKEKC